MKKAAALFVVICILFTASAQTLIPIPDTLSGSTFMLTIRDSVTQFYPGYNTGTIGYNGSYLGPTIILHQGDSVTLMVHNLLSDTTTTHWHGLHVSPMNDGGPHTPILSGQTWMPHFTVLDKAATYWYHPHLHGKTMEQIVKGAAGLIIVRDDEEAALTLPRTYGVDDIPLLFQFETFDTVTKQIVVNDEFDNAVLVNGTLNAMVNAPAQFVRLRLLNASSLRFFRFGFEDNRQFHQITTDGGLLDAPVSLTRLDLSPGERAEIIVDLTGEQGDTLFLKTHGSEFPAGYPGGPPILGMPLGPLDNIDFTVLQINVTAATANAVTSIPAALATNEVWQQAGATTRFLDFTAQPMMSMDNFFINGVQFDMEVINFSVQQESIEIWNLENLTFVAHPFHIHGNHFYVIQKNGLPPPANELGRKDVVLVPAMSGVKIITKFADFSDTTMPYMYHCHLLHHEDEGMMGHFLVSPLSPLSISASVNDVSCFGGSDGSIDLSVSGGIPGYSFQWSNGGIPQNLPAGTYSVTVTDSYGSTADYSAVVNEPTEFDIGSITGNINPADSSVENYSVVADSQYTYQWSVTNGQINAGQGTSEVQVEWQNNGQGELTVIAGNGACSDTAVLMILISSINSLNEYPEAELFQNPNDGSFTVRIKTPVAREVQVSVMNILGQVVYESARKNISGEHSESIALKSSEGIYFVKVRMGADFIIRKIIAGN